MPTHDYMSIAIEFDNGQDITWYWSHSLAPETFYRCPLAGWDKVETHIVVQSGQDGLGEWHQHKRNIYTDYSTSVGGEMPKKIVGVWFIGTLFSDDVARTQNLQIFQFKTEILK